MPYDLSTMSLQLCRGLLRRLLPVLSALALAVTLPAPALAQSISLALPWAPGQAWRYVGGPHSTLGCPDKSFTCTGGKPWNSLDFSGGDGVVRAAADGTVEQTTQCPARNSNFVIINHGEGWHTTYYHLIDIPQAITEAGHVVHAGDRLGKISAMTGCEGHADGPHVHFSVARYQGPYSWHGGRVDLGGFQIGSWLFHDGHTQYSGCATNVVSGHEVCPGELMSNNGAMFEACRPVSPVVWLKASGLECADAQRVVSQWGQSLKCGPNGTTCQVDGFTCRVQDVNYTELDCDRGNQRLIGKLGPY